MFGLGDRSWRIPKGLDGGGGEERENKWVSLLDPRGKPEDGGDTLTWGQWRSFS